MNAPTNTSLRRHQVFVSPTAKPASVASNLPPNSYVLLIPVSPEASEPSTMIAAHLIDCGHRVSVTRPLAPGTDISGASRILSV